MHQTSGNGSICHVCQSDSAAALVRALVSEPVIEIADDHSVGPLHDIDSGCPQARIAFWTEVLCACNADPGFSTAALLAAGHQAIQRLVRHRGTIVIWAGSHVADQIMRRRLHWWLRDTLATVGEIRVLEDSMQAGAGTSVAMHDVAKLRDALNQAEATQAHERRRLAHEWTALRSATSGVRMWDNGKIVERPYAYMDRGLLASVGDGPILLSRLIASAVATTGCTDTFWRWRVRQLVAQRRLELVEGSLEQSQTAVVSVARQC